jgi:hypothetical protein
MGMDRFRSFAPERLPRCFFHDHHRIARLEIKLAHPPSVSIDLKI